MTVSLDEFRTRPQRAREMADRLPDLRGLAQEAPRMAALTGSADWDLYLRYVEAHIKTAERMAEAKKNQAAALVLTEADNARAAAVLATVYQTKAETLRELIIIPRWIIENGAEAAKKVAELEASV
jgi:hypothetical protein